MAWPFLIPISAIVCTFGFLTVVAVLRFVLRIMDRRSRTLTADEERMLQELWRGIQKMETRIGNLETILIHREQK